VAKPIDSAALEMTLDKWINTIASPAAEPIS
jgi:hypothetical protein